MAKESSSDLADESVTASAAALTSLSSQVPVAPSTASTSEASSAQKATSPRNASAASQQISYATMEATVRASTMETTASLPSSSKKKTSPPKAQISHAALTATSPSSSRPPKVITASSNSSSKALSKAHTKTSSPSSAQNPSTATSTTTATRPRSVSNASGGKSGNKSNLRRGKWTVEEETYVARVIQDFNSGYLDAPAGTTLRTYLSEKLQCDPMRITKKFTGDACIGKRVFHPAVQTASNAATIEHAQMELKKLEERWHRRLEIQQSESAKKAAASAAAVAAARGCCLAKTCPPGNCTCAPSIVRAAGWLERAKEKLGDQSNVEDLSRDEIVSQMEQVQRLLTEGPATSKSATHPRALSVANRKESPSRRSSGVPSKVVVPNIAPPSPHRLAVTSSAAPASPARSLSPPAPDTKRMRSEDAGAEADAAALVNFLQTVQAAAAASTQDSN